MYTENVIKDIQLFGKSVLSNQLANFAPKVYVNVTHQTGRGSEEESPQDVGDYFIKCFRDYYEFLDFNEEEFGEYLTEKTVMEYGPGDVLGLALLCYAHGAKEIHCVDKFELSNLSKFNIEVYRHILSTLDDDKRERANHAFNVHGEPESGINSECIKYKLTKNGASGETDKYDLILSRAVLQHVNDLSATFQDIKQSMKQGGISIHQVDLRSLGLDRSTELDFLTWPSFIYQLMYAHKGFPNRWRLTKYKELAAEYSLQVKNLVSLGEFDKSRIEKIHKKLSPELTPISLEELCWKGFWLRLEH